MRGKKKASKRFEAFRKDMKEHFKKNEVAIMSEFMAFVRDGDGLFLEALVIATDKDENLLFDLPGPCTTLYQILRLANRPILLREVDSLFQTIAESGARAAAFQAFSVLYSVGLVDYKFKDVQDVSPASVIQIFLKED